MEIKGVSHPIPTEYAKRIYREGKTVYVGKSYLSKVVPGDKFIIYESHGARAYTGWADIKSIGKQKIQDIWNKFGDKLIINKKEFNEYSKGRSEMNIIEFENFEKFPNPVKPKKFITKGGKYIYENDFEMIKNNKG